MKNKILFTLISTMLFSSWSFAADKKKSQTRQVEKIQELPKENKAPEKNSEKYENIALFQKVLFYIEQNYVEDVKSKDLLYGAIKGMMETLDPHSNFLPPEVFKDMKTDTQGKFGGVGLEVGMKDNLLVVISPIEDTPAYRAGIKAGDKIIKIDGESAKGMSLSEAVSRMRGKKGTEVKISIWREGMNKPKEYKFNREEVKIATVKSELLEPNYLYAKLTTFNENSTPDLLNAIEKAEKSGLLRGIVLDLRNNPGGLLDQAVDVTSLFVDDGVVVSTIGRNPENKEIRYAKKGMARKDIILAVLVNGSSASASEIVAGALQDHKRAVVMGQPTFGKGSVQTVVELAPDVGMKLTIARYYTPSGKSIQLKGIQPDILLDELDQKVIQAATKKTDTLRERDLRRRMENTGNASIGVDDVEQMKPDIAKDDDKKDDEEKPIHPKDDYMVREALNYVKSYQLFRAAEMKSLPTKIAEPSLTTPNPKKTN